MDAIQEVIHSLDETQQKEFVFFVQRNKYKKGRKDLQLFQLLKDEVERTPLEFVKLLGTSNLNAYHTIRKRLFNHLADFIVLKSTSDDASTLSHVNGLMAVVNYLFDKGLIKHAWKYLVVAEKLAYQHHYYDQLNSIYLLQIEKAHLNDAINLDEIVQRYQDNQTILRQNEKLQIASGVIRNRLNKQKEKGIEIDFQRVVTNTLDSLQISVNVLQQPDIVLTLMRIIRSGVVAQKEFYAFEPFLEQNYKRLYKSGKIVNPVVQCEFLYILSHTGYRNKKFKKSLDYINELREVLGNCSRSYQKALLPKIVQLQCANLVFLNRLDEALGQLMALRSAKMSPVEHANTIVNLGIYHFLRKDYKASLALLNEFKHSDNWYIKQMGVEWVLKRYLMEVLLFIELGHVDVAESRMRTIERKFNFLKEHRLYNKAFGYVQLLKKYLSLAGNIEQLKHEIKNSINFVPYEEEDIQAMAFYAWIKSKTTKHGFYETLVGLIR